jgi:ABC-type sugar transport system substrate-binding protein
MVAQGVKGIAITPTSAAVSKELDKAIKKGVKVVLMDNDIPAWKNKTSVVATNNYKGGLLAGKYLATRLKAGDTLGILEGVPGVPALDDRVKGMLAGLGSLKSKIKVVSKLRTDCDQTKGAAAAQTMLTANPELVAMYGACGPPILGALQSIKNAGIKPADIIVVGFDALPDEVAQIKAGNEDGSVAQFPAKIGSLGIATLYNAVLGKKVPKNVDTGTAFVTKANASKFG